MINFVCFVYLPFIYFQFNVFRKINIEVYNHNLKLILKLLRNDFYACFVYVPTRNGIYSLEHLINIDCILMDRTKREKSYFSSIALIVNCSEPNIDSNAWLASIVKKNYLLSPVDMYLLFDMLVSV